MFEQRFDTPQPVRLVVTVPAGEIEVKTVEGDRSTVTLDGSSKLVEGTQVALDEDRLVVQQRRKSLLGFMDRCNDPLRVRVSIPLASDVEIVTASAQATLEGSFRNLQSRSASGNLDVIGEISGTVRAQTVSGDVHLPCIAGALTVKTVSGDVEADAVEGSVDSTSVSGDVRVGSVREGTVAVQSVSGDVTVGIASGTSIDVDAGSASGHLSSELPLNETPSGTSGPTVVIRSKTVSGDFHLVRAA